jgi:hypothetical protein
LPSRIAQAARTTVKPVKVPATLLKQVLAKGGREEKALKDSLLLQFKNAGEPVELTGLPTSKKAFPAYLVLSVRFETP